MAKGKHVISSPEKQMMTTEEQEVEDEKFLAMVLIQQSDSTRFGDLVQRLGHDMNVGQDTFPSHVHTICC